MSSALSLSLFCLQEHLTSHSAKRSGSVDWRGFPGSRETAQRWKGMSTDGKWSAKRWGPRRKTKHRTAKHSKHSPADYINMPWEDLNQKYKRSMSKLKWPEGKENLPYFCSSAVCPCLKYPPSPGRKIDKQQKMASWRRDNRTDRTDRETEQEQEKPLTNGQMSKRDWWYFDELLPRRNGNICYPWAHSQQLW